MCEPRLFGMDAHRFFEHSTCLRERTEADQGHRTPEAGVACRRIDLDDFRVFGDGGIELARAAQRVGETRASIHHRWIRGDGPGESMDRVRVATTLLHKYAEAEQRFRVSRQQTDRLLELDLGGSWVSSKIQSRAEILVESRVARRDLQSFAEQCGRLAPFAIVHRLRPADLEDDRSL